MDPDKMQQLRRRYAEADAFSIDDPGLQAAAAALAQGGGRRSLPYSGVPTFLGLPSADSTAGLDIALVGVPMDLGVSNRPGARFGPRAVRSIERIGPYHPTFRGRFSLEQSLEDIEEYYAALTALGVRPLSVGGDHSITYPILKALGKK